MQELTLLCIGVMFGSAAVACGNPAAREAMSAVPPPQVSERMRFSHGGCSIDLPGVWKRLPATDASNSLGEAERGDGSQTVSIIGIPIPKPGPTAEWREDLSAVINLRRDGDREAFGSDASFSSPEYRAHPSSPWAFYSVYNPNQRALRATLVKMARSRFCLAFLSEDGAEEAAFNARAKALLERLEVEP